MRNPRLLETKDTLNIQSLKHLALRIGISKEEIIDITENIRKHYRFREETKIKNGRIKKRKIYRSTPRLKKVLKAINNSLLKKIKLSDAVHGSRKKHSPLTNAKKHVGQRYVLGFDIENFFPSIRTYSVFNMFRKLKCSPEVSKYLTRLCTADNHIPQGYNTSPAIANLVSVPFTERLHGSAKKNGQNIGTFIDDICFSGNNSPEKYMKTIEKIINECGYRLKSEKTTLMKKNQQQKITGVVVNVKPNIDKKSFKDLKKMIHICEKFGPAALIGKIKNKNGDPIDSSEKLRKHLLGRISHVNQLNAAKAENLREKFNGIIW